MKRIAVPLFIVVLTAGCASAPDREYPNIRVEAPEVWTAADVDTAEQLDTTWWLEFKNPGLNTLVDQALLYNYTVAGAAARVDRAAALAKMAGADMYPQVSAGVNTARRQQIILGIPIPGQADAIQSRTSSFGVSLDVLWEVDLWGRIRAGQSAALADLEASWADLAGIRLSIASQTVKAWLAMIEARLQTDLAEETVVNFRMSADQVRSRYELGVRSSLDLRLALANLAGAEALLEARREQLDRAKRQLEILLGRYPGAKLAADSDLPAIDREIPSGLPSDLLIRRPDLLSAERRFAAAEKRVSEARRAFFPRITLTGSTGSLSGQLEDLVDGDFSVWSIAAGLTQPLFQGGRLVGNYRQSAAVSDMALADYALAILTAFGEVESALYAEEVLARREGHSAEAARQSELAQQLAIRQYGAGLVDYITVLETQRRALNSQSELISVRRRRLDARVNLYLALGGGFDLAQEWTQFLASNNAEENGE